MIALMILSIFGCSSDQEIKALRWDDVAMVSGDFDHMGASLVRMGIDYTEFEGFISQAVYNPEIDSDSFQLTVEYLLEGETESGGLVMSEYDVLFINSGARGLGDLEYNSMDEDDAFVSNPQIAENLYSFTSKGKSLVLSDWAGDLVEAAWPDAIQFARETSCDAAEGCWDIGQSGVSTSVVARVTDDLLQQQLGTDAVTLQFDFTYWTVMESVADDVDVYLRGDVEYRLSDSEGYATLEDVPLLVGFNVGGGRVIFSSFHWHSQNADVADTIMLRVAEGLTPAL